MRKGCRLSVFQCFGEERYQMLKQYGFDCADIAIDGELGDSSEEKYCQMILHEKKLADEAKVTIWQVHGPWKYPPHDETEDVRRERLKLMKRSIRCTAMIGCKYWVIHPLMPYGPDDEFDSDQFWNINLNFFRDLLSYAKQHDVTICFENMPMKGLSISSPEQTLRFVRLINDEHFAMCFDTGHAALFDHSFVDFLREGKDKIKVLHIHDNHGMNDEHLIPYMGVIDWKEFVLALKEIEFDGVFSMEAKLKDFLPSAPLDTKLKAYQCILDDLIAMK